MQGDVWICCLPGNPQPGSYAPDSQLEEPVLLAGPRPLPNVGQAGRDVELGARIKVILCPRDSGAQALGLQPGGGGQTGGLIVPSGRVPRAFSF